VVGPSAFVVVHISYRRNTTAGGRRVTPWSLYAHFSAWPEYVRRTHLDCTDLTLQQRSRTVRTVGDLACQICISGL
jgi:hypothetical protein